MELPLAEIERIMRNAGAERLSENAVLVMQDSAQDIAEELARDAVAVAREAGHRSVTAEDVQKAIER